MPALIVKEIKPRKLKIDAVRLELLNVLDKVGRGARRDFQATTATWKHKPKFEIVKSLTTTEAAVLVGTDDKIYGYVDEGTREHPIFPVRAKALRFKSGYIAKTAPGVIGSQAGGSFGDDVIRPYVLHPGTEARRFSEAIAKRWKPQLMRLALEAVQRGVQKAEG